MKIHAPLAAALFALASAGTAVAAPGLHRFTSDAAGFDTNSFYYDTGKEVVVFDAQFTEELARKLLADIKKTTRSPVKYVHSGNARFACSAQTTNNLAAAASCGAQSAPHFIPCKMSSRISGVTTSSRSVPVAA